MAGVASRFLINHLLKKTQKLGQKGFTLLELLVAVIIGSLISSLLLFIVVELVKANRREEILTQTQQSMQRAMDYVTRDLGEAVFVYAEPTAVTDELDDLPVGSVPVLAFWRLDPVDVTQAGSGINCEASNECTTLRVRQSSYTLVVYVLQANAGTDIWEGPSRIIRYTLPTYQDITTLALTPGYQDPSVPPSSFENWAPTATATVGNAQVLTDYVDLIDLNAGATNDCPDPAGDYQRTPADTDSFYTCILFVDLDGDGVPDEDARTNQNVFVYLQGNPDKPNLTGGPTSAASRLPRLETAVLVRGVIGKGGDQ